MRRADRRADRRIAGLLIVALLAAGCASLAPGEDPVIVRTEQLLAGSDAFYVDAMIWYNQPGVAEVMDRPTVKIFEALRTGFDRPYKITQDSLDAYKSAKARGEKPSGATVEVARVTLASVLAPVVGRVPAEALKTSRGKPLNLEEVSPFLVNTGATR